MMPAAAPAQPDEPAVLEGAVRHRLVLDEAFVKSIPADVTFETDKGKSSGRYTAALTMRPLVESEIEPAGGLVGAGFDEFHWPRPVRPGDELHIESKVLEVRPSRSRSNQGLIKVRTTTLNQNDEAMQVQIANLIVPRRQSADSER